MIESCIVPSTSINQQKVIAFKSQVNYTRITLMPRISIITQNCHDAATNRRVSSEFFALCSASRDCRSLPLARLLNSTDLGGVLPLAECNKPLHRLQILSRSLIIHDVSHAVREDLFTGRALMYTNHSHTNWPWRVADCQLDIVVHSS
jgi:hypothetical protein